MELQHQLRSVQADLATLIASTQQTQAAEPVFTEEGQLDPRKLDARLSRLEAALQMNHQVLQHKLDDAMEEQVLALGMLVGLFVMSAFYLFYCMVELSLRQIRRRLPRAEDWHTVRRLAALATTPTNPSPVSPPTSTAAAAGAAAPPSAVSPSAFGASSL